MLIDKITNEEIELIDAFYYPVGLASCLFSTPDALHHFNDNMLNIRLGQYPLLPYGGMIDDNAGATVKETFNKRKNASEIFCFGGRKFGKCEDVDNLCLLANGEYKRFGDLIGQEEVPIISFNENTLTFETSLASFYDNGLQDVIKITLENDNSITVTHNHPIYTSAGWIDANRLTCNHYIGLYDKSIEYNKIASIDYILEKRPTVAVWVPNNNTYISNNIISHNTFVGILISMLIEAIYNDYPLYIFSTYDGAHTSDTMSKLSFVFKWHPIFKFLEPSSKSNPSHTIDLKKIGWHLDGINMDTDGGDKNAGEGFIGKHSHVVYVDEATRETDTVKTKRKDAGSELGCIAENSKILMSDLTTKNIQDVVIGDEILGWDEERNCIRPTKVLNVINSGLKDVISIENYDNSLYLTPNHKLVSESYNWKPVSSLIWDNVLCYNGLKDEGLYYFNQMTFEYIECTHFKENCQVYDLTTETHNFIANGFIVHNSIERRFGMTDILPTSPAGQVFFNKDKEKWVMNVPQYINPLWDEKEKLDRIEEYGGEQSDFYRVYVKGEVIKSTRALLDMVKIKTNSYIDNKRIKLIEITDENVSFYDQILFIERSKNADAVYVSADIGDKGETDIKIIEKSGDRFFYKYSIVIHNQDDGKQVEIFKTIIMKMNAEFTGIDTTDGTGRAICRQLQEIFSSDQIIPIHLREKIEIGKSLDKDLKEIIFYEQAYPLSVKLIKDMLYNGKLKIPLDNKLDKQLSKVEGLTSANGLVTTYRCNTPHDHSFQSLQIFVLMNFIIDYKNLQSTQQEELFCGTFGW